MNHACSCAHDSRAPGVPGRCGSKSCFIVSSRSDNGRQEPDWQAGLASSTKHHPSTNAPFAVGRGSLDPGHAPTSGPGGTWEISQPQALLSSRNVGSFWAVRSRPGSTSLGARAREHRSSRPSEAGWLPRWCEGPCRWTDRTHQRPWVRGCGRRRARYRTGGVPTSQPCHGPIIGTSGAVSRRN